MDAMKPSVGDFIKVQLFGPDTIETAWAQLSAVGRVGFIARLANQPVCGGLKKGDPIARPWEDALEHLTANEAAYG
jgi:hypothetical protein